MSNSTVIVIGAGLSGLSCAKWLKDSGINDYIILEARDRVGGRTFTKRDPKVNWVDLGGSYVGPTQDYILRQIKDLGLKTYKVHEDGKQVFYSKGKRITYGKDADVPFLGLKSHLELNNLFRLFDSIGQEIPAEAPWTSPRARELDQMTFKQFIEDNFKTEESRSLIEVMVNAFLAVNTHEVSALSALWYIKQCFGSDRFFSVGNGGQERKIHGGTQQISERLAERVGHDRILFNKVVYYIHQDEKGVRVRTLDGHEFTGSTVVMALPPPLLNKIHFDPCLPPLKAQMIQKYPMGSVIKAMVYYRTPFWRKKGFSGAAYIDGHPDKHPIDQCYDDTKVDGTFPALVGFCLGDKCRRVLHLTKEQRRDIFCKSYAETFDDDEALKPVHYEECVWPADPHAGGGFTAVCPPGLLTGHGDALRVPYGRIFFAGTETSSQWSGYMNGAVEAGERAAREVMFTLGYIPASQVHRTEPPSKEVPPLPFPPQPLMTRMIPTLGAVERLTQIFVCIIFLIFMFYFITMM